MKKTAATDIPPKGSSGVKPRAGNAEFVARRSSRRKRIYEQRAASSFAEYLRGAENRGIEAVRSMTGVDISDHGPERLRLIDATLDCDFRTRLLRNKGIEGASMAFGAYLGEVFIRNLGGRWHYPRWFQAIRASISRDRYKAERYCYVLLGEERVYVFRAAREAAEKTGAVFSLYGFYRRYARRSSSGSDEDSPPPR